MENILNVNEVMDTASGQLVRKIESVTGQRIVIDYCEHDNLVCLVVKGKHVIRKISNTPELFANLYNVGLWVGAI